MKIIHCADLHLDSKMTTHLTKEQAKERKAEILRTFSHMVDYAASENVAAIMISGDLFDTRNVSATARNVVKHEISSHPEIQFFYLKGNHDNDNFLSKMEELPDNLHLFSEDWISYHLGDVTITGIEITGDNTNYMYQSLVLAHENYNIVMMHGQLADYQSKKAGEIISLDQLKNKNIDYLALGHVHERQTGKLDARGMYAYSGCLEGRGFDECGDKGFIVLDINEQSLTATYRFVSVASRVLYELPVDVSSAMSTNDAAQLIEAAINEKNYPAKSMVKILLTGELDVECELNEEYLAEMFADYFYFVKISNQTKLRICFEDYAKDESLKGEFVRIVQSSDLSEQEKAEVIRMGVLALSGEEI